MEMKSFDLDILQLGPLETNCYLIADRETGKCIIIDPAYDAPYILSLINKAGLVPEKIILTHGHYDHIGALQELAAATSTEAWIHTDDSSMLIDPARNFSSLLGAPLSYSGVIHHLSDGDEIFIGANSLSVIHTPGHTPGGICLAAEDFLISGDTLFNQSVGRTDFPGGSTEQLMASIRNKIFTLDGSLTVFPGHGPPTTILQERNSNPFFI